MKFLQLLGLAAASSAAEKIVGVYMFHRHGDRTPKILPPTSLTDLGYREVYTSGNYYRSRYVDPSSSRQILNIATDVVNLEQIAASAPLDNVLQSSAQGFLQSLYPPVGKSMSTETLADGDSVSAPMGGYQIIPVNLVEGGSGSEDSSWLQDSTACNNAEISSNNYYTSKPYTQLLDRTMGFYRNKILPTAEPVFNRSTATFENAYTIYDYLNVARIHNTSGSAHVDSADFKQLHWLANTHEFNLAYNSSDTIRAVAGAQLAAEIVDYLGGIIESQGESKFGVQFGSYGTFFSFFGLAQLPAVSSGPNDFMGVPNYASAMTFELYTPQDFSGSFPPAKQLRVRFLWHNGTTTADSTPQVFPLFGTGKDSLSWAEFKMHMNSFAIGTTREWCHACGNTTGTCAPFSGPSRAGVEGGSGDGDSSNGSGLSGAVCGVIGAMVTLAVVLLIELVILLAGGFTIVRKKRLAAGRAVANGANGNGKA